MNFSRQRTVMPLWAVPHSKPVRPTEAWELALSLPYTLFQGTVLSPKPGDTMHGNFYKCGDELPEPHFLSWHPIHTPQPDFHRPDWFGELIFD